MLHEVCSECGTEAVVKCLLCNRDFCLYDYEHRDHDGEFCRYSQNDEDEFDYVVTCPKEQVKI